MKLTGLGRKNRGFALPEVLCAIIILSLSILASFAAMSYALTLTNEGRGRMDDFSLIMRQGVAMNVWAEDKSQSRFSDKDVGEVWREAKVFDFTVGGSPVTAAGGGRLWLDMTEFKTSFDTAGTGKRRLMESPVFLIFSTAGTASDDAYNFPEP